MNRIGKFVRSITVEPVLFLFELSYVGQSGLSQDLTRSKLCLAQYNETVCNNLNDFDDANNTVQAQASYWFLYANIASIIPSLIFLLYLGSWSDVLGRKLPLLFPLLGLAGSLTIFVIMSAVYSSPVWLLVIANFILGVTGSSSGCVLTCNSYLAQITTEEERTVRISRLQALAFLGLCVGPLISGAVVDIVGRTYTFLIFFVVNVVNIIYIAVVVTNVTTSSPEIEETKKASGCNKVFTLEHLRNGLTTPFKRRSGNKRKIILLLLCCVLFQELSTSGENDILYLYTVSDPLDWTYSKYSYFTGIRFAIAVIANVIVLPAAKYLKVHDFSIAIFGFLTYSCAYIVEGLAFTNIMMLCVMLLDLGSFITIGITRSQISLIVEETEQGKIFSSEAILQSIASILASLIYNSAYPATTSFFSGLLFEVTALYLLVPLSIYSYLRIRRKKTDDIVEPDHHQIEAIKDLNY